MERAKGHWTDIHKEASGHYSWTRVWGSIFNCIALGFLIFSVAQDNDSAREIGFALIGGSLVAKVGQKFGESPVELKESVKYPQETVELVEDLTTVPEKRSFWGKR